MHRATSTVKARIWMDHCHNLQHAADGLLAHLAYTGVTEPYVIGGPYRNDPE